jgi:hypothetical protein
VAPLSKSTAQSTDWEDLGFERVPVNCMIEILNASPTEPNVDSLHVKSSSLLPKGKSQCTAAGTSTGKG